MSAYFVTATGTDIGKTYVTAGLVRYFRSSGRKVNALKPIVSGFESARAAQSDSGVLLDALGEPQTPTTIARISPWRFTEPLSPDMAAAREGRSIDFEKLIEFCRGAIGANEGTLFIEGVGGIMVPLDGRHTVLDWASALDAPLIVVTGSYLGSISHTLTALRAIAQAKLTVAALVVNETGDGAVDTTELVESLSRFASDVAIKVLPRNIDGNCAPQTFGDLARALL
jgi:dethiobiotin synthetase